MNRLDDTPCPACGGATEADACPVCGAGTGDSGGVALRVLPQADRDAAAPAEVQLIRQLKLRATSRTPDPELLAQDLPDVMEQFEDALGDEDFADAEQQLDRALASVLAGPGHERRGRAGFPGLGFWSVVLWSWLAILGLLWLWSLL